MHQTLYKRDNKGMIDANTYIRSYDYKLAGTINHIESLVPGYGTKLIQEAISFFREKKCVAIHIEIVPQTQMGAKSVTREKLKKFYKRNGFSIAGDIGTYNL